MSGQPRQADQSADVVGAVAAVRAALPADAHLVSLGPVDSVTVATLCGTRTVVVLCRPRAGSELPYARDEIATIPLRRSIDRQPFSPGP